MKGRGGLGRRLKERVRVGAGESQRGVTLVEFLVTISLTSVLGLVLLYGVENNQQLHRNAVDESTGLADVKTVVERLGRDVRSARSIDAAANQSKLVLWVDYNSDYIKSSSEIVTWQLVQASSNGEHYNVLRQTEGGVPKVQARTLISQIAFCYWVQSNAPAQADCTGSLPVPLNQANAELTRLVTTTMTYDAFTGNGTKSRKVSFSSRLRNVS